MYRKLTADEVFTGYDILPEPAVLVIDDAGVVINMVSKSDVGSDIEYYPGILCPGFVNAHCHLELSHMKGAIPKHTGLVGFVKKVMMERDTEGTIIPEAIEHAGKEMLQNGIVAVGDICNTAHGIFHKKKGLLHYHNFIEVSGFIPGAAGARFQKMCELYDQHVGAGLSNCSIVPHAPYSVSKELLKLIVNFPDNNLLTIHNQEADAENELFMNKQGGFLGLYKDMDIDIDFFNPPGISSLKYFLPDFRYYHPLILVHDVSTSEEDILFALSVFNEMPANLYFCLCPNANLYINNVLPNVELFRKHQCNIILGTNSLASNDQLSILKEIETLQVNFPKLPLSEILQWATINGAYALGISDLYGSFSKGKKPGVLQLNKGTVNRVV